MLPFDEFGVSSSGFGRNKTEKLAHFICLSLSFTSQQGQDDFFRDSKSKTREKTEQIIFTLSLLQENYGKSFVVQEYVLQERTISDFNITHLIMYVLPFLCNAISM